jgi:hypothetical protein
MLKQTAARIGAPTRRRWRVGTPVTLLLGATLAGCAWHWPWRHSAPRPPPAVHELTIESLPAPDAAADAPSDAPIAQYWDRNALLLDLSALQGPGAVTLSPSASRGWPIRLEFRVRPGAIARLEVEGSSRVVFEVPTEGAPLLLKLGPDAYRAGTAHITLRWRAVADSAH